MSRLFGRSYKVTVDTIEIEDSLDIEFKITRTIKSEPNKVELKIYNLNPDNRSELISKFGSQIKKEKRQPIHIEIEAGYVNDRAVLVRADLRNLIVEQNGSDFVTVISGADGAQAYRGSRINKHYGAGTTVATVILECAKATGLGLGNLQRMTTGAKIPAVGASFAHGTTKSGNAYTLMVALLTAAGFVVSTQNGVIQVQKRGEALPDQIFQLAPDSGLIGSPKAEADATAVPGKDGTAKKATAENSGGLLNAKCLLIPGLYPGLRVDLQAADFKGNYQITEVTYDGSTFSQNWYADLKLRAA